MNSCRLISLSIITTLLIISCRGNQNEIVIKTFYSLDSLNFQRNVVTRKSYLVYGYHNDHMEEIDKHVCSLNIDSLYRRFESSFSIIYFRKSNFTNNEEVEKSGDRMLYEYSYDNDHIATYNVVNPSLISKRFYGLKAKYQYYKIFTC